jgi:hypothetical protein
LQEEPGTPDEALASGGNDTRLWSVGGETKEVQFNICSRKGPLECVGDRESGHFLVFASYGRLLSDDTDDARDIYRYDMVSGKLERVSGGEEGFESNGNCEAVGGDPLCDATLNDDSGVQNPQAIYAQHELTTRAISEDGSRIVFMTASPLAPAASNGLENVYEWQRMSTSVQGSVSMISTGSSLTADKAPVLTPVGNDLFFATSQGLARQDTDGQADVYDARIGGGLPTAPAEMERCSADACQGPLSDPIPLLVPGSMSQTPGGNITPSAHAGVIRKKVVIKKTAKRKQRRRKGRTSRRKASIGGRGR